MIKGERALQLPLNPAEALCHIKTGAQTSQLQFRTIALTVLITVNVCGHKEQPPLFPLHKLGKKQQKTGAFNPMETCLYHIVCNKEKKTLLHVYEEDR